MRSPVKVSVVFFNLPEANELDTEVNAPDISVAICDDPDITPAGKFPLNDPVVTILPSVMTVLPK